MAISNDEKLIALVILAAMMLPILPTAAAVLKDGTSKREAIHRCLLQIYISERRRDARAEFDSLLALNPNDVQTHYDYANWLRRQDEWPKALFHYKVAAKLQPTNADFSAGLAAALFHLGRYDEGVKAFRRAGELDHVYQPKIYGDFSDPRHGIRMY